MTDEGQSPEAEPVDSGKSVEGQTPSDQGADVPERFKGKTVAEVAKAYQELESLASRQENESKAKVQELSEKTAAYENWARGMQQQQQQPPPQAQQPPADIYDNPMGFVQQAVQPGFEALEKKLEMKYAMQNAQHTKFIAKQMYPDAFNGVEDSEIDRIMAAGAQYGAIAPTALSDPNAWKMAAVQIKYDKGGFKQTPQGMSPTQGESPSARQPDEETAKIPENMKDAHKIFGISQKDAQELFEQSDKEVKEGSI